MSHSASRRSPTLGVFDGVAVAQGLLVSAIDPGRGLQADALFARPNRDVATGSCDPQQIANARRSVVRAGPEGILLLAGSLIAFAGSKWPNRNLRRP